MGQLLRISPDVLIYKLNASDCINLLNSIGKIPPGVNLLDLSDLNLKKNQTIETLAQALASIPASVTSLNLSKNNLGDWEGNRLKLVFAAIPAHVKTVNLEANKLFFCKKAWQKDEALQALGTNRARFVLTNNDESDIARALGVLVALHQKTGLTLDIAAEILSFLPLDNNRKSPTHNAYKRQLENSKEIVNNIMSKKQETLTKTALGAIDLYLDWSNSESNSSDLNGFFSSIRHGQAGRDRAQSLKQSITSQKSYHGAVEVIETFLNDPKTRYNRHSMASYLLNNLARIKGSPWEKGASPPDNKPHI